MKKSVRGFTLVELIVSMMLLTLVIALSSSVMMSSSKLFQREVEIGLSQGVGNGIINLLEDKVKYGVNICFSSEEPDNPSDYSEIYYVKDGRLYVDFYDSTTEKDVDIFGDEFYLGNEIRVKADIRNDCLADLTVEVYEVDEKNSERSIFTVTKTVKMVNIGKAPDASITYNGTSFSSDEEKLYICIK